MKVIKSLLKRFGREPKQHKSKAYEPIVCRRRWEVLEAFKAMGRRAVLEPEKPINGHEGKKFRCTTFHEVRHNFVVARGISDSGKVVVSRLEH